MTDEEKKPIVVKFEWATLRPDTREYKQQSIELLSMNTEIAVEVPEELVYDVEKIDDQINIVLTPAGMRYVQEQIEKVFSSPKPAVDDTDWGDGEKPTTEESKDEDWEDDVPWSDSAEKTEDNLEPDIEKWNEEKEEW